MALDRESVVERMVATSVQPNVNTWTTVLAGYTSFGDRARVFQRMCTGPSAVAVTKDVITTLIASPTPTATCKPFLPSYAAYLMTCCAITTLWAKRCPLSAEGNGPQLMHRL